MQFDCKACSGRWWEVERTYGVYDVKIYIYIYIYLVFGSCGKIGEEVLFPWAVEKFIIWNLHASG